MEDKDEENYSAPMPQNYTGLEYSLDQQQQQQLMKPWMGEPSRSNNINGGGGMVDYMLNNPRQPQPISSGFCSSSSANSFDKLSFADVMQFADFGPKLALNQNKIQEEEEEEEETGIDPVFFLKFPVLQQPADINGDETQERVGEEDGGRDIGDDDQEARPPVHIRVVEDDVIIPKNNNNVQESKNKRKRPRTIKTTEEVESQRMTHIAVERNRRKQMNEHLRVLRSLMPGSYVQRGDQASIIGGAIEFVRELEQLLQCLESQKRRRIFGSDQTPRQMGDSSQIPVQQSQQALMCAPMAPLPNDQIKLLPDLETAGLREETAENKSCLADVEVKLLGFDAMIKILSRRRPGQLIKTIAALEDLHLNILHTNITTIEQTVLYSFNVKVGSESRFTAEDMASSVQQIFSFIHANSSNM